VCDETLFPDPLDFIKPRGGIGPTFVRFSLSLSPPPRFSASITIDCCTGNGTDDGNPYRRNVRRDPRVPIANRRRPAVPVRISRVPAPSTRPRRNQNGADERRKGVRARGRRPANAVGVRWTPSPRRKITAGGRGVVGSGNWTEPSSGGPEALWDSRRDRTARRPIERAAGAPDYVQTFASDVGGDSQPSHVQSCSLESTLLHVGSETSTASSNVFFSLPLKTMRQYRTKTANVYLHCPSSGTSKPCETFDIIFSQRMCHSSPSLYVRKGTHFFFFFWSPPTDHTYRVRSATVALRSANEIVIKRALPTDVPWVNTRRVGKYFG
jgi:hypothetical protein